MDLEIVGRRGNAIIVAVSFDMTKARPFGLAFHLHLMISFIRSCCGLPLCCHDSCFLLATVDTLV